MAFVRNAPEGTRLPPERELAVRFGVSRTTLRSATDRLATLGYLDVRHGAGTVTRRPGPEQLASPFAAALADVSYSVREVYAVRLIIEPPLAALVAKRPSPAAIASLRSAAAGDDATFHELLAGFAGNGVARQVVGVLIGLSAADIGSPPPRSKSAKVAIRQHSAVVEAVAEEDPDLARESLRLNLRWEARRLTANTSS